MTIPLTSSGGLFTREGHLGGIEIVKGMLPEVRASVPFTYVLIDRDSEVSPIQEVEFKALPPSVLYHGTYPRT